MNDSQFDKLFKYVERRFDSVDSSLQAKAEKGDIDRLIDTMDDFIR